jgi:hypothetical protein
MYLITKSPKRIKMKRITFAQTIFALLTITSMASCNNADKKMATPAPVTKTDSPVVPKPTGELTEATLIGKWKTSEYFDEAAVAKMMGEPNADKGTMTFSGEATYYVGGTGKSEGYMTLSYPATESNEAFNIKMSFNVTATWKLNGNELIETTVDAKTEPANDETRELLKKDPSLAESLRLLKGETEKYKIINYTATLIELEGEDKVRITMHKEQ